MGRKRKAYSNKLKIEVVKEALRSGGKQADVAVKHDISPSTLNEWIQLFIDGKIETEEQAELKAKISQLEEKNEMMLKELGKKQLEIDLLKKNEDFWDRLGN